MRLPQICIERPVLSTVMSLVLVVVGLLSLDRLPNRELPDIEVPIVTIRTILIGRSAIALNLQGVVLSIPMVLARAIVRIQEMCAHR